MGGKLDKLKALLIPSTSGHKNYRYKPLRLKDSIRLLELRPADSNQAPIDCILTEIKLAPDVQYEALSYVWGEDVFPETLHLPSGYLNITANLASALRALRLTKKSRVLWVDAVCINQTDDTERSSQVVKMSSIYTKASQVLAWLPNGTEPALVDMEAITSLSRKAKELGLGKSLIGQREIFMAWLRCQTVTPSTLTQTMDFMTAARQANFSLIYTSAWYQRMWIVQEALLATRLTLVWGPRSLSWEDFELVMILLHTIEEAIHLPVPHADAFVKHAWNLVELRNHYRSSDRDEDQTIEFQYYASQLRRRDCKDDRDRVYALKALLPENSALVLTPDYGKSIVQVLTDLAVRQLRHGHIDIFYQAGLCRNLAVSFHGLLPQKFPRLESAPSWAPDYRKRGIYIGWKPYFGDQSSFRPDPSSTPTFVHAIDNPQVLMTGGTFMNDINNVFPIAFVHDDKLRANYPKIFFLMRNALEHIHARFMMNHGSQQYLGEEDPSSAFANALLGGGTSNEYREAFKAGVNDEVPSPPQIWEAYQNHCLSEDGQLYQEMRHELESSGPGRRVHGLRQEWYENTTGTGGAFELTNYLKTMFRYHVFFTTSKGYIGLAPVGSGEDNDIVAFIEGLKVPFVLRNVGGSDWKLVGPCYLHGMMDADAARTDETVGTRTTFRIT